MAEGRNTPNISPYECAIQLLADFETVNDAPLSDLLNISYVRLALMLCPGVKTFVPAEDIVFYLVEPSAAHQISVSATGNRDAYDMLTEICRANVWAGNPIPQEMRAICTQVISGKFKPPPRQGPPPGKKFGLFFVAYLIGKYLVDAYDGNPKMRGDGFDKKSAAEVVARALSDRGVEVSETTVRDYLSHKKHKANRQKSDWIRQMMYEPYLAKLGLITKPKYFGISPIGLFLPIGRMT